ncbi:MAG TPA: carboxypeptidase-like regulatory domain-containing protein, partial [Pyrinomonadaceae bacterium]|nr:carboxypeptidase-like regulatory domain-containing protein [Pyrinomonadaceae bacterium]
MLTFTTSRRSLPLTLICAVLLAAIPVAAQVLYGSLVGNVTDPNGAAIAGARVEITNVATGTVTTTTTDDRGAYSLHDLQAGVYKVSISGATFKTTVKEDVRIEANKTYRFDAQLEIGGVEETVLVTTAQEATLQTDRADVNVTQSARQINNLPL